MAVPPHLKENGWLQLGPEVLVIQCLQVTVSTGGSRKGQASTLFAGLGDYQCMVVSDLFSDVHRPTMENDPTQATFLGFQP